MNFAKHVKMFVTVLEEKTGKGCYVTSDVWLQ